MRNPGTPILESVHALFQGILGWRFERHPVECDDCPAYGVGFTDGYLSATLGRRVYAIDFRAYP